MKRLLTSLYLAGCFAIAPNAIFFNAIATFAQTTPNNASDLFYTFYGQKIPLILKPNTIAVSFKSISGTRSPDARPLHQQLQDALNGTSSARGGTPTPALQADVTPLGDRYALIQIPANTRGGDILDRVQKQTYVEKTLPVLSRPAGEKQRETTIVLPNEILLSFDPGLAQSQVQTLLNRHDLEIIRPLRFTQNRYLVRSRKASGTDILNIANRLANTPGIQSSTPNFVQSIQYEMQDQAATGAANSNSIQRISQLLAKLPQPEDSPLMSNLLPLQWHLNSTPRRGRLQPRTDIRATEAWRNSQKGKDVVVAVIDSVIQWDHPDLVQQVYQAKNINDPLPGETQGWDFTSENGGDPDTRMSAAELKQLRPIFQQTFTLSDKDILKQYADLAALVRRRYKDYSDGQVAALIRSLKRSQIAAEFHGT